MRDFLGQFQFVISTGAVVGVFFLVFLANRSRRADASAQASGLIRMNRLVTLAIAAFGLGLAGLCFYIATLHGQIGGFVVGTVFGASGLVMLAFLSPRYHVRWDAEGISGPISYAVWPFGPARATIPYDRIVAIGIDWANSACVEDAAGNRIRWSQFYRGYGVPIDRILAVRPDLFPDAAEGQPG